MEPALRAAATVIGIILSVPFLIALVKSVFFIASATTKLDGVIEKLDNLIARQEVKDAQFQSLDRRVSVLEDRSSR